MFLFVNFVADSSNKQFLRRFMKLTTSPSSIQSLLSGSHALQLATAIDRENVAIVLLEELPVERFLLVEFAINLNQIILCFTDQ